MSFDRNDTQTRFFQHARGAEWEVRRHIDTANFTPEQKTGGKHGRRVAAEFAGEFRSGENLVDLRLAPAPVDLKIIEHDGFLAAMLEEKKRIRSVETGGIKHVGRPGARRINQFAHGWQPPLFPARGSSNQIVESPRDRLRRFEQEAMTGLADHRKRAGKPRVAHLILQADKFSVACAGHPNQPGRQAQRVGELPGDRIFDQGRGKFPPVKVPLFTRRRGMILKNSLPIPMVCHHLPPLGAKCGGPIRIGLPPRHAFLLGLEIPRVHRKQQSSLPFFRRFLQPTQSKPRTEGITGQPTRTLHGRRSDWLRPGREKIQANPAQPRLGSGPHLSPIAALPEKARQRDHGSVHGTTRRSRVSR